MKKLFSKNNKISKILALCLAFAMILVTVSTSTLSDKNVRAEGNSFEMGVEIAVSATDIVAQTDADDVVTAYHFAYQNVDPETYYTDNKAVVIKNNGATGASTIKWKESDISSASFNVGYKVAGAVSELNEYEKNVTAFAEDKTTELSNTSVVGIYAKYSIAAAEGNVTEEDIALMEYTLVRVIKLGDINDALPDVYWADKSGNKITKDYWKDDIKLAGGSEATYKVLTADNTFTDYSLCYAYSEEWDIANGVPGIDKVYGGEFGDWKTKASDVALDKITGTAVIRSGFVAFKYVDGGANKITMSKYKTCSIIQTGDTKAPSLNNVDVKMQVKETSTWTDVSAYDKNSNITVDTGKGRTYRLVFTIPSDADSGVGVDEDSVKFSWNGTETALTKSSDGKYYTSALSLDNSYKTVGIKVSDLAENTATKTFTGKIKGVDKTLVVSSCKITSDQAGNNAVDLETYYYTNNKYYLSILASSGYKFAEISATYEDEDGNRITLWSADNLDSLAMDNSTSLYTYKKTVAIPLNSMLDSERKGNVKFKDIHVYIKDSNGQVFDTTTTSSIGSFFFDNVEPVVASGKLQSYTDGSWSDVDLEGTINVDGSYTVQVSSSIQYRYAFTVKDENGSGIKSVQSYTNSSCTNVYTNGSPSAVTGNWYACSIKKTDIGDSGLTIYIKAIDDAGNSTVYQLAPSLVKSEETLSIDDVYIEDAKGNRVVWSSAWDIKTNNKNTVYVKASSGSEIVANPELRLTETGDAYIIGSIVNDSRTYNKLTKRYEAVAKFVLPKMAEANEKYSAMTVVIKDEASNEAAKTLGELIYDKTLPQVKVTNLQKKWISDYKMDYIIKPGDQAAESKLDTASYSIDDGTLKSIAVSGLESKSGKITVPESKTVKGTKVKFYATDEAGNEMAENNVFVAYVDNTKPDAGTPKIEGVANTDIPVGGVPVIKSDVKDNLTLAEIEMSVKYPNGTVDKKVISYSAGEAIETNIERSISYTVKKNAEGVADDGEYSVKVKATDKAGNIGYSKTVTFTVDNTAPETDLYIVSGTPGGKATRDDGTDYYYKSDVTLELICYDENLLLKDVVVTDNGTVVSPKWSNSGYTRFGELTLSDERKHTIVLTATDKTGNASKPISVEFVVDKTPPVVTTLINGMVRGPEQIDLTTPANVGISVSDMTFDSNDVNMKVKMKKPDQAETDSDYVRVSGTSFAFAEEADYSVSFIAGDMANNQSEPKTVNFRVDTAAPVLNIGGISGGGTSANSVGVTFSVQEAFWWDAGATVSIYRKAGDGMDEQLLRTVDMTLTGRETSLTESLVDSGIYRFEFNAHDRVGHTATMSQTFTIDREAPEIILEGVKNYDKTKNVVDFLARITDDFYSSKKITINGTRTDITGKVNTIDFGVINQAANPTLITQKFKEDGIYDVSVTAVDVAGNTTSESVHFIVDKTAPIIGDLSKYDGKVLKEFKWEDELDNLVSDLTVCDIHMYLNGSEYDGESAVEDGVYTLLIEAVDELGNSSEKSIKFTLDTKAPVFIVTGVEDGEIKKEIYNIDITLQLDEDKLQSVTLNGDAVNISSNACSLTIDKRGSYELVMNAIDEAGNEATQTINFRYGSSAIAWWVWLIIGAGVLAVVAGVIVVLIKNKKED